MKCFHKETDAYEWDLYAGGESGYDKIAEIRCDDVTIEKITRALNENAALRERLNQEPNGEE